VATNLFPNFSPRTSIEVIFPFTCMYSVSAFILLIGVICVRSICLNGKYCSRSEKIKIPASFFKISALKGPTPLRYSMGLDNMETLLVMIHIF
jgi:hypothetical protein